MDLIFNELSETPLCFNKTEAYDRVGVFISTYKSINNKFTDFNRIRFDKGYESINLLNDFTLGDFCKENRLYGDLLRGLYRSPYIDDQSPQEDTFIEKTFVFNKKGIDVDTYGLAVAYIYSVPAIGFLSETFWKSYKYELSVNGKIEHVFCLSKSDHIIEGDVFSYIENKLPVTLVKSSKSFKDKPKPVLRDDHGKDTLLKFSYKLYHSDYVECVINSLPFNSACKNFIRKTYPDGKIEIVLTKTDKGLGIIIQTTGRNIRETNRIAEILEEEYCN